MANLVTNELPTTATEGPSLQSTQGKQNASQRSKCKYKTSRKDKLRQMRTLFGMSNNCEANEDVLATANMDQ